MKHLLLLLSSVSGLFFGQLVVAAWDLEPNLKLGSMYCYDASFGDANLRAEIILSDRPLISPKVRARGEADPTYRIKPGTKLIHIATRYNSGGSNDRWDISYPSKHFYRQNKGAALICLRKLFAYELKEFPITDKNMVEKSEAEWKAFRREEQRKRDAIDKAMSRKSKHK